MFISICMMVLAFTWMLLETDYLRIRLPIGKIPDNVKRQSWTELKQLAKSLPDKLKPFWLKYPENMIPLCGIDWLENTMHVIPETKIELVNCVHHYTIKSNNSNALRDAFRVYRNPYLKVKLS